MHPLVSRRNHSAHPRFLEGQGQLDRSVEACCPVYPRQLGAQAALPALSQGNAVGAAQLLLVQQIQAESARSSPLSTALSGASCRPATALRSWRASSRVSDHARMKVMSQAARGARDSVTVGSRRGVPPLAPPAAAGRASLNEAPGYWHSALMRVLITMPWQSESS